MATDGDFPFYRILGCSMHTWEHVCFLAVHRFLVATAVVVVIVVQFLQLLLLLLLLLLLILIPIPHVLLLAIPLA